MLDLGTGGGVPGLILAAHWPASRVILLDSNRRRMAHVAGAVTELGWADRVVPVLGRAEEEGRGRLRASVALVVSRSFGPPPVTAECGAAFLRPGGHLLVAEPPDEDPGRWPAAPLAQLGLALEGRQPGPPSIAVLRLGRALDDRYPRRTGIPDKRPLW